MTIMKKKIAITMFIIFLLLSCGSKKTVTQSDKKEDTNIDYSDNSKHVSDVELGKQYVSTNTKERIVTMYGVRFDTMYVDGKPFIRPLSFITNKEEIRNINTQNFLNKLHIKDSINNAIRLEFKGKLENSAKEIKELKETKIYYQIAVLVLSIIGLVLVVLYFISRTKLNKLIL